MSFIRSIPFLDLGLELTTLSVIAVLLSLSLLSLGFVFHLRLKSRTSLYLQSFNSLWTVRFLLVSFISLWAINEVFRIPLFRDRFLYSLFFPIPLSYDQQSNLCKIQVVLSLGLFEPAFLLTLLFLVNASIKKTIARDLWAVALVIGAGVVLLLCQILFVFFSPLRLHFPEFFDRSFVVTNRDFGTQMVLCAYPFASTVLFAVFVAGYTLSFLVSFRRVVSLVISKALRSRLYKLALTLLVALPMQILFLGLSVLWNPEEAAFGAVALVAFLCTFACAAVGEGILVIRPITDSLAAGGDCCCWTPNKPPSSDATV